MQSNNVLHGSIREIGSALKQNQKIYDSLSQEERENAAIGGKLLEVIQAQDSKYKELRKSISQNQVEVGNYKQAIFRSLRKPNGFAIFY